MRNISF